jgi:hypothetical protein
MIIIFSSGETWIIIDEKSLPKMMVKGQFVSDGLTEVGLVNRVIIDADLQIPKALHTALLNCVEGNQNLITKI